MGSLQKGGKSVKTKFISALLACSLVCSFPIRSHATTGHSLLVNAIYSDNSKIMFSDPIYDIQPGVSAFYEKSANTTYKVCTHVVY